MGPEERAALYSLFAHLLTAEPSPALLETLRAPALAPVLERARPGLGAWLGDVPLDAVRAEFARLFLLPKGAAPYASAWLEGDRERLAEQLAAFTHRAMEALDMTQTNEQGRLSLDHLGLIYAVAAEALRQPATAALGAHVETQLLGPWVARFATALAEKATLPLYEALGALILATLPPEPR